MRTTGLVCLLLLALPGCYGLFPRPTERANPRVQRAEIDTIAVIAGGDRTSEVQVAQRARERIRERGKVTVVSVSGLWSSERAAVDDVCGPAQQPQLDGLAVFEADDLRLWDCGTREVAFEARGGWRGVRYLSDRLLEYLEGRS